MTVTVADIESLISSKRKLLHDQVNEYKKSEDFDDKEVSKAISTFEVAAESLLDEAKTYHPDKKTFAFNKHTQLGKTSSPFDPRFPNQNQTRHCYQSYLDYHRCINLRGEEFKPCQYFLKTFKTLCPNEWVETWDEQRENGSFPSKL